MKKDKVSIIINLGILFIAILSALVAFNSYRLNIAVIEVQKKLIKKQIESFDSQDKLNKEQFEYFHSQKIFNERNLQYIDDLMSPDIYFVAIPQCRSKYTIGKISGVNHSAFIINSELEFRINNRGKKPINLIDIIGLIDKSLLLFAQ